MTVYNLILKRINKISMDKIQSLNVKALNKKQKKA
jgi:hypothetical protein